MFKIISFKDIKKPFFVNSRILGIECEEPNIDLIIKIGADFEGLMATISWMMPKNFPFQIAIPSEIFPELMSFAHKHDICLDIVIRGVMLAWSMEYDSHGEILFPLNKFVLQQYSKAQLNDNETALMLYLSHKIESSKFKNAPELQDIGVQIFGDDIVLIVRNPDGGIRKIIE